MRVNVNKKPIHKKNQHTQITNSSDIDVYVYCDMKLSPFKGGDDTTQFGNMGMKISMVMRSNDLPISKKEKEITYSRLYLLIGRKVYGS